MVRVTTEEFIEKARKIHGERYDYSKTVYICSKGKVIIICKVHGEFLQTAGGHLQKNGCSSCSRNKKKTTEEFIKDAIKIHDQKYDYSKVQYKNAMEKVIIICKIHGEFFQMPYLHLYSHGCSKCVGLNKTTEDFVKEAKEIHGNKYDYSKTKYVLVSEKVIIICKNHGEFLQTPNSHLSRKGCPKCVGLNKTTGEFIKDAEKIHGQKYDYSKVDYFDSKTKIIIICRQHSNFMQIPNDHLNGAGCPKCCGNERKTTEQFIIDAIKIHGEKYDYSKVEYDCSYEKVIIICKTHGEFNQEPHSHLKGYGCAICKSSKGENFISLVLQRHNIRFEQQKTFEGCKYKSFLKFDFYLPDYNLLIEYDGLQHFQSVKYFGGDEIFEIQKTKDQIKTDFANDQLINLLRIYYTMNFNNVEKLIINTINSKENLFLERTHFYLNKFD